jgi:predicted RecA/RadA family phage recombinase
MKTEQPILISTVTAAEDLLKNLCVTPSGTIANDADEFLGVCNADTNSGEETPVSTNGIVLCYSAGAISAGQVVKTYDNGTVQPDISGQLSAVTVGRAIDAASGADELIRVKLL